MEAGRFAVISVAHLPQRFRDQLNAELDNQPPLHSRNDQFLVTGDQNIFHIDPFVYGWYFFLREEYLMETATAVHVTQAPAALYDLAAWMKANDLSMVRIDTDGPEQPGLPMYEDGEDLPACT